MEERKKVVGIDFQQVLLFDKSLASEEKMVCLDKYCGGNVVWT